jgi:hypothetical protein
MLMHRRNRVLQRIMIALAVVLGLTSFVPANSSAANLGYDAAAQWDQSPAPYLGWSSWSMQATTRSGVNPQGNYSWLTEQHILEQADYMAAHLKQYGYEYINIDAGWWRTWNWTPVYDEYGRPAVWQPRLPDGMAYVVNYIHSLGLKVGIYMPAGMETGKEGDNGTVGQDLTKTIYGAPQCTLEDAIYPDHRTTNGWNSAYALDFDNGNGCAAAYIDSIVDLFQSWGGVDLLKVDGVGPGSGHNDITGANARYDNRPELAEYDRAFQATGRHVEIQASWSLNINYISDWQRYADSWRTSNDVECYCADLTTWSAVSQRLTNALQWARYAGPTTGWSNLDSLEIGSAALDGLTETERRTAMSMWSIAAAPLYLGDDLTQLDAYGLSLATNTAVLAVDQDPLGGTLVLVGQNGSSYVVARPLANGDIAIALVNLGDSAATIGTSVAAAVSATSVDLAKRKAYAVTDLWSHTTTQTTGAISASVPAHGTSLLRLSAAPGAVSAAPSTALTTTAADDHVAPGGTTTVAVSLTNTSKVGLSDVSLDLAAPAGWDVAELSGPAKTTLPPLGGTATATFAVTAPSSVTAPISSAALTGSATYYSDNGGTQSASTGTSVWLVSPVQAPLTTADTTGGSALFGQSGSALGILAAGANVGPATGGPGGTTAAGDAYGAIYQPGRLGTAGSVQAVVTAQSGGSSAKAGVFARNDADAAGTAVGVALYLSNGRVALVYNNSTSGGTSYTTRVGGGGFGSGSVAIPVLLRLTRSGASSYTGTYSTDGGTTWTIVGTVTANGQSDVQDAGVFQSSGSTTTAALATFTDLDVL